MTLIATSCCGPRPRAHHPASVFIADAVRDKRLDPTGTQDIRRAMRVQMDRRWQRLRLLVQEHMLSHSQSVSETGADGLTKFQVWIDDAMRRVVMGDGNWMRPFILDSALRAESRAKNLTGQDVALDDRRVNMVVVLAAIELQGVMEAVSQQAVRALSTGGLGLGRTLKIGRDVTQVVTSVGRARGRMVCEFAVVKMFGVATLDAFRSAGVTRVGTKSERIRVVRGPHGIARDSFDPSLHPHVPAGSPEGGQFANVASGPIGPLEKHSAMRDYTKKELDWEYEREYLVYSKPHFPDAFASREDFQQKYDAAPLVHLTLEQLQSLGNSMAGAGFGKNEQWVHDTFGHRRDSKRIIDHLRNNFTAPPIVLRSGSRLRLMAGQTRLAAGLALGRSVPVKIIDVKGRRSHADAGDGIVVLFDKSKKSKPPTPAQIAAISAQEEQVAELGEVDVLTAGDEDVCPECEDISLSGPYDIDTAESLIPAHPNCRCAFVPTSDERFASVEGSTDASDENPYHEPAGTSQGGEFAHTPGVAPLTESDLEFYAPDLEAKFYWGDRSDIEKSLNLWLSDDYASINQSLRHEDWHKGIYVNDVKNIDRLFDHAGVPLSRDVEVYRGTAHFGSTLRPGDIFTDRGYVSTTVDEGIADMFTKEKNHDNTKGTIMSITVPRGTRVVAPAATLNKSRKDTFERELMLRRDTKFKVTSIVGDRVRVRVIP